VQNKRSTIPPHRRYTLFARFPNADISCQHVTPIYILHVGKLPHVPHTCVAQHPRHRWDERLVRWLLILCDRVQSNELLLTQEFISQMLGIQRAGVMEAANSLQQAGLIRCIRGKITILNQQELGAASCECYEVIKGEYARLVGKKYS